MGLKENVVLELRDSMIGKQCAILYYLLYDIAKQTQDMQT